MSLIIDKLKVKACNFPAETQLGYLSCRFYSGKEFGDLRSGQLWSGCLPGQTCDTLPLSSAALVVTQVFRQPIDHLIMKVGTSFQVLTVIYGFYQSNSLGWR